MSTLWQNRVKQGSSISTLSRPSSVSPGLEEYVRITPPPKMDVSHLSALQKENAKDDLTKFIYAWCDQEFVDILEEQNKLTLKGIKDKYSIDDNAIAELMTIGGRSSVYGNFCMNISHIKSHSLYQTDGEMYSGIKEYIENNITKDSYCLAEEILQKIMPSVMPYMAEKPEVKRHKVEVKSSSWFGF